MKPLARLALAVAGALAAAVAAAAAQPAEPSLEELRARADAGDAAAQNDLGGRLFDPNDPERMREVRELFRRSMAGGNAEAKGNYALMLMMGWGGPADVELGRRLRDEAAAEGSMAANLTLADRYLSGSEGYPRDPVRAFEHTRIVASSTTPSAAYAQWRLGVMHLQGVGTRADPAEAHRWIRRAAEAGEANAMASMGVLLATGQGVAEDDVAARSWYRRAAESARDGFQDGLRGLGWMLVTGEGGPEDLPTGVAYLMLAEAAGAERAGELLVRIADHITPEIREQARAIGDRWIADHRPE